VKGSSSHASAGYQLVATTVKATACSVWPEGKLNTSSGATRAMTLWSLAQGRGRRMCCFIQR
jgi:hypothetical protein